MIVKEKTVITAEGEEYPYITVDAWSSGNPGLGGAKVTYRGRIVHSWDSQKPYSNNFLELVAIIIGLQWLIAKGFKKAIVFSDSMVALSWALNGKPKKKNINHYEETLKACWTIKNLLRQGDFRLEKWDTARLGEIPADAGRK